MTANIDAGMPWRRSYGENIVYTDWRRDNFQHGVQRGAAAARHRAAAARHRVRHAHPRRARQARGRPSTAAELVDVAQDAMRQRMIKSAEEIAVIKHGARIGDLGGEAIKAADPRGDRRVRGRPRRHRGDGPGDRPDLPGLRDPRHLGVVPVGHQHRRRAQLGHHPQAAARRHPVAQLLPDDLRLLHGAGADPVPRRARRTLARAVEHQRRGAPPRPGADQAGRGVPGHRRRAQRDLRRLRPAAQPHLRLRALLRGAVATTTAGRPAWSCARTSTPSWSPAWSSRWSR